MKARLHVRPIALACSCRRCRGCIQHQRVGCGRPGDRDSPDHRRHGQVRRDAHGHDRDLGDAAHLGRLCLAALQRHRHVVRSHRRRLGRREDDLRPDLGRRRPDGARRRDGDRRRRHDGFALGRPPSSSAARLPRTPSPDRLGHHDRGSDPRRHRRHLGRCGADHVHVCLVALRRDGWRVRADRGRHGQDLPARRSRQRQDAALVGDGQEHARQRDRDLGADRRGRPAQPAQRRDAADGWQVDRRRRRQAARRS